MIKAVKAWILLAIVPYVASGVGVSNSSGEGTGQTNPQTQKGSGNPAGIYLQPKREFLRTDPVPKTPSSIQGYPTHRSIYGEKKAEPTVEDRKDFFAVVGDFNASRVMAMIDGRQFLLPRDRFPSQLKPGETVTVKLTEKEYQRFLYDK